MARKQPTNPTSGVRVCLNHRDPATWKKVPSQNPRWVHIVCGKCNGNIAYESIDGGKCGKLLEAAQGIKDTPSQEPATTGELPISNGYNSPSLFG